MLTEEQVKLWNTVLDANWEFDQERDWPKRIELARKLRESKEKLVASMGKAKYDEFIRIGQEMFASR